MNVGNYVIMALIVSLGLFIAPSLTIIGLLFAGLFIFFKGKEEMDKN
jgi:hypothetical protein